MCLTCLYFTGLAVKFVKQSIACKDITPVPSGKSMGSGVTLVDFQQILAWQLKTWIILHKTYQSPGYRGEVYPFV